MPAASTSMSAICARSWPPTDRASRKTKPSAALVIASGNRHEAAPVLEDSVWLLAYHHIDHPKRMAAVRLPAAAGADRQSDRHGPHDDRCSDLGGRIGRAAGADEPDGSLAALS